MIQLPIHKMSTQEKIAAMEALWNDLCQQDKIESPAWHKEVLDSREKRQAQPIDWTEAKQRIMSKIK